jgi:hypothetical protein
MAKMKMMMAAGLFYKAAPRSCSMGSLCVKARPTMLMTRVAQILQQQQQQQQLNLLLAMVAAVQAAGGRVGLGLRSRAFFPAGRS